MNPEHSCKCPIRSIMERDGVCYSCAFWIRLYEKNKNNPNWLIIDGESWIANPFVPNTNNKTRRFMGMGGRMMEAISNDGRKIISNDWWHQGKIPEEFKDLNPELESINSFNDTVKKANEIKDRVLKYVYNIKQERSYNNDLVGIFERYKDIADGDMEVAMNFIKEAYPFNEETESFIRKKFDMPMPNESKEQ